MATPSSSGPSNETKQHEYAHFACDNETCALAPADTNKNSGPEADKDADALRTAYGGPGNIYVLTNYVKIQNFPKSIHHYTVKVRDEDETNDGANQTRTERRSARLNEKKRVFNAVLNRLKLDQDKSLLWATDYTNIWMTEPLQPENIESALVTSEEIIQLNDVCLASMAGQLDLIVDMERMPSLDLPRGHLDVATVSPAELGRSNAISALNAMMNRRICESDQNDDIIQVGANRFFMVRTGKQIIKGGCETMRGYFTSVRPGVSELLMNVNTATAAFYRTITVAEFMKHMSNDCGLPYDQVGRYLEGVRVRNETNGQEQSIAGLGETPGIQRYWKTGDKRPYSVLSDYPRCSS